MESSSCSIRNGLQHKMVRVAEIQGFIYPLYPLNADLIDMIPLCGLWGVD